MTKADFFGFFCITESDTLHVATIAEEIGAAFPNSATDYGGGVKGITAVLIATDPEGLGVGHRDREPRFQPGARIERVHGFDVHLEDTLEFSLRPNFKDLVLAKTTQKLAKAIAFEIPQIRQDLEKVEIPNFDSGLFVEDLEEHVLQVAL